MSDFESPTLVNWRMISWFSILPSHKLRIAKMLHSLITAIDTIKNLSVRLFSIISHSYVDFSHPMPLNLIRPLWIPFHAPAIGKCIWNYRNDRSFLNEFNSERSSQWIQSLKKTTTNIIRSIEKRRVIRKAKNAPNFDCLDFCTPNWPAFEWVSIWVDRIFLVRCSCFHLNWVLIAWAFARAQRCLHHCHWFVVVQCHE